MPQTATYKSLPILSWPVASFAGATWQLAQSPRNTAWRLAIAIFCALVRSTVAIAPGSTMAFAYRNFCPLSVLTVRVLVLSPPGGTSNKSMVAEIVPFSLGDNFHGVEGNSATVQWQEVVTEKIVTSPEETFVRLKAKCASVVPLVTRTSFCSASKASTLSNGG